MMPDPTFDRFESFVKLDKTKSFTFSPSRFEIWFEGRMVDSGQTKYPIYFVPIQDDDEEKIKVMLFDSRLLSEIENDSVFDEFISGDDRLRLVTVPVQTSTGCMGITALKMVSGPTRDKKEFGRKDPYCCNLFLVKSALAKVAFVFSNPERMVEIYSS